MLLPPVFFSIPWNWHPGGGARSARDEAMTSFDPRTWHLGHTTPSTAQPVSEPGPGPAGPGSRPGEPARATRLGFALSALILAGGAVGAYTMRPPEAAPLSAALNFAISPSG